MRTQILVTIGAVLLAILLALVVQGGEGFLGATSIQGGLDELNNQLNLPEGADSNVHGTLENMLNYAVSFLTLIAVIAIVVAGFVLIFSFGGESGVGRAKKIIIYTIIGILVIYFATVIVSIFTSEIPGEI